MDYRGLVRRWIDGLRKRKFPRRVTAPGGGARWLDASGKSFETAHEARHGGALGKPWIPPSETVADAHLAPKLF